MRRFPFKGLYMALQRLNGVAHKMMAAETKITDILNDFDFDLFNDDEFSNGVHSYAVHGEFAMVSFEEYVKIVKEAIKELTEGDE